MSVADITPGTSTLYRVWLLGRLVCATNDGSLAMWALLEAKRWASRCLPANNNDDDTDPPPAVRGGVPRIQQMEAA